MNLLLTRKADDHTETTGLLILISEFGNTLFKCVTLERPDKGNANGISCIPKGTYICIKIPATEHIPYEHILVQNVSGRAGICIHIANYVSQIQGCIVVGDSFGDLNHDGEPDVLNSKKTFDELMELLSKEFKLVIQ